jgi:hypothetical protein
LFAGIVCYRDYSFSFDCTIRDLSEVGARLRVISSAPLPSRFYLIHVKEGVAYDAEIAWTQGKDVGVKWGERIPLIEPNARFSHLRRLWSAKRPFLRETSA